MEEEVEEVVVVEEVAWKVVEVGEKKWRRRL
jgi:hypothetical protein